LLEKPFTTSYEDTKKLLEFAESKNLYLQEAYWTSMNPIYIKAKEWIINNKIGKLRNFNANFIFPQFNTNVDRLTQISMGAGNLFDIGFYVLSQTVYFIDHSLYNIDSYHIVSDVVNNVDINGAVILKYKSHDNDFNKSIFCNLYYGYGYNITHDNILLIHGTDGYIKITPYMCSPN